MLNGGDQNFGTEITERNPLIACAAQLGLRSNSLKYEGGICSPEWKPYGVEELNVEKVVSVRSRDQQP
jgi:hypothetical protein